MSNILNFEDHIKGYKFQEQVVDILAEKNSLYEFGQDGDQGLAYFNFRKYVYIFFQYIPYGQETEYPTLADSIQGFNHNKRFSTGEWVVDQIAMLDKKNALRLFPFLYAKNKQAEWIQNIQSKVKTFLEEQEK